MHVKKFLIANGNSTALVYDCEESQKSGIARDLLKEVEQVGFVSMQENTPRLQMMGGELCINATIAFASTLGDKSELSTSGLEGKVRCVNNEKGTTITIPLQFRKEENVVLLEGIGYVISENREVKKEELLSFCEKFHLPAFGAILYNKNTITPIVYVQSVDSFVHETACGSGSIAFSIFAGVKDVVQPTSETISVIQKDGFFDVTARVTPIADNTKM